MKKIRNINLFTILVSLLPFLYQYKSPIASISFGEAILMPFIIYYFFKIINFTFKKDMFNGLYIYFLTAFICGIIASIQEYFSYGDFITKAARLVYYALLIYVCYYNYNFKLGLKVITFFAIFFSGYAILQFVVHLISGNILSTVINPNWVFSAEAGGRLDYEKYYKWLYRSSSLFLEPGYYVSYCAPALVTLLFYNKINVKKIIMALLITVGFLVSTSSAGLVILLISWGMFILNYMFSKSYKIKINRLLLGIVIAIILVFLIISPLADTVLKRTSTGGSFNNRITRTYILLSNTNLFQKIFGVGINNVTNFVKFEKVYTQYDETSLEYVSTYLGTFLCSGIITFIFYNLYFIKTYKKNKNMFARTLILIFLFLNIIGNISFSSSFAYYAILIFAIQKAYLEKNIVDSSEK